MAESRTVDIFQRYQRGFLGKTIRDINPENDRSKILKQLVSLQYGKTAYTVNDKDIISNDDVEVLYSQYSRNEVNVGTFDFHEAVIKAALDAFGTTSFIEWLEVQKQSPVASYSHSKFILDTLHFISTGKRDMVLENWEPLLNSNALSSEWEDVMPAALALHKYIPIARMSDAITSWCSKPGGISDLLITMHILFGK